MSTGPMCQCCKQPGCNACQGTMPSALTITLAQFSTPCMCLIFDGEYHCDNQGFIGDRCVWGSTTPASCGFFGPNGFEGYTYSKQIQATIAPQPDGVTYQLEVLAYNSWLNSGASGNDLIAGWRISFPAKPTCSDWSGLQLSGGQSVNYCDVPQNPYTPATCTVSAA